MSARLGLTGNTPPSNLKRRRLSHTRLDQCPLRSEAPTRATLRGLSSPSMSFLCAVLIGWFGQFLHTRAAVGQSGLLAWIGAEPGSIRFLVQELLHADLVADFLVVTHQRVLLGSQVVARLIVRHAAHRPHGFLGGAHHAR